MGGGGGGGGGGGEQRNERHACVGSGFWQGLKLMISTCAAVESHHKKRGAGVKKMCRQKHLQHSRAGGAADGETSAVEEKFC